MNITHVLFPYSRHWMIGKYMEPCLGAQLVFFTIPLHRNIKVVPIYGQLTWIKLVYKRSWVYDRYCGWKKSCTSWQMVYPVIIPLFSVSTRNPIFGYQLMQVFTTIHVVRLYFIGVMNQLSQLYVYYIVDKIMVYQSTYYNYGILLSIVNLQQIQ